MTRKYKLGDTFDYWWEIVSIKPIDDRHNYHYTLRNKANGMEITLSNKQMREVANGVTSISKVWCAKRKHNSPLYNWKRKEEAK